MSPNPDDDNSPFTPPTRPGEESPLEPHNTIETDSDEFDEYVDAEEMESLPKESDINESSSSRREVIINNIQLGRKFDTLSSFLSRVKWKRVVMTLFAFAVIGLFLWGVLVTPSSFIPLSDGFFGCPDGDIGASVATFESDGEIGTRLAMQAVSLEGTDVLTVKSSTGVYLKLKTVGDTVTITSLQPGDTVAVLAERECGPVVVREIQV